MRVVLDCVCVCGGGRGGLCAVGVVRVVFVTCVGWRFACLCLFFAHFFARNMCADVHFQMFVFVLGLL